MGRPLSLDGYLDRLRLGADTRAALRSHLLGAIGRTAARLAASAIPPVPIAQWHRDQAQKQVLADFGRPDAKGISLAQLEAQSVVFLELVQLQGRPLDPMQRKGWRYLLTSYERPKVKAQILASSERQKDYYQDLMRRLREVFYPDPVKRPEERLQGTLPTAVAQMHDGNCSTVRRPFTGVSIRRLSYAEARVRIGLILRGADDMEALSRELSLARDLDRPEAARIAAMAERMHAYADGGQAQPAELIEMTLAECAEIEALAGRIGEFGRDVKRQQAPGRRLAKLLAKNLKQARRAGKRLAIAADDSVHTELANQLEALCASAESLTADKGDPPKSLLGAVLGPIRAAKRLAERMKDLPPVTVSDELGGLILKLQDHTRALLATGRRVKPRETKLIRAAQTIIKQVRDFAARCQAQPQMPKEPSLAELTEMMATLSELTADVPDRVPEDVPA